MSTVPTRRPRLAKQVSPLSVDWKYTTGGDLPSAVTITIHGPAGARVTWSDNWPYCMVNDAPQTIPSSGVCYYVVNPNTKIQTGSSSTGVATVNVGGTEFFVQLSLVVSNVQPVPTPVPPPSGGSFTGEPAISRWYNPAFCRNGLLPIGVICAAPDGIDHVNFTTSVGTESVPVIGDLALVPNSLIPVTTGVYNLVADIFTKAGTKSTLSQPFCVGVQDKRLLIATTPQPVNYDPVNEWLLYLDMDFVGSGSDDGTQFAKTQGPGWERHTWFVGCSANHFAGAYRNAGAIINCTHNDNRGDPASNCPLINGLKISNVGAVDSTHHIDMNQFEGDKPDNIILKNLYSVDSLGKIVIVNGQGISLGGNDNVALLDSTIGTYGNQFYNDARVNNIIRNLYMRNFQFIGPGAVNWSLPTGYTPATQLINCVSESCPQVPSYPGLIKR